MLRLHTGLQWFQVGSPTAFADEATEKKLRMAATQHGIYIPSGAFWGGEDIKKMADRATLQVSLSFSINGFLDVLNITVYVNSGTLRN